MFIALQHTYLSRSARSDMSRLYTWRPYEALASY
jgi:hypothetical protein